jgi:hypothetical protein
MFLLTTPLLQPPPGRGLSAMILLAAGAVMIYIVGRWLASSLRSAVVRGILFGVVVMWVSLASAWFGRSTLAIYMPVAVASCAVCLGVALCLIFRVASIPQASSRSWLLLVPASVMLLLTALNGSVDQVVLLSLSAFGFLSIISWEKSSAEISGPRTPGVWWVVPFLLLMAGVAAFFIATSMPSVDLWVRRNADVRVASLLLAPAIVVPLAMNVAAPRSRVNWSDTVSTLLVLAIVCVCIVLPLTVIAQAGLGVYADPSRWTSTTRPVFDAVELPAVVGGVDAVVLVVGSLLIAPLAAGVIRPGRLEGGALLLVYLSYQLLVLIASV